MPVSQNSKNSSLHRIGIEFNFQSRTKYFESVEFKDIPENLVLSSVSKAGDDMEILLFEADGKSCVWKNPAFGINEAFNPYEIKKVEIKKQTGGCSNAEK